MPKFDGERLDAVLRKIADSAKTAKNAAARRRGARLQSLRKGGSNEFNKLVQEGERAYRDGKPKSACPYSGDQKEAWLFGYEGMEE